jgi:hypothetical protein
MAKKAKATQAPETETTAMFTRAELVEQLMAMTPEERLAAVAESTTPEERKSISAKATAKAAREKKEKEQAEATATREAERVAIRAMDDGELAVYSVKHQTEARRVTTMAWSGSEWLETEEWYFGKDRASRSGASIVKRVVDPERVIFPTGTRLELRGTEHVHASRVCEALGMTWKPDSAARVLCNAALAKGDSLGVKVRVTTPAGTTSTELLAYAKTARVTTALETRPE